MIALIPTRAATLVAAICAAASMLALTLSPPAQAHAHSAVCTHSTINRSRHNAHSCTSGTGKGHHKGKPRTHTKTGAHPRAAGSQTPADSGGRTSGAQTGGGGTGNTGGRSGTSAALCEDGSAPQAIEEGENGSEEAFVCEDSSEPACAEGFSPIVSGDGLQLLCEAGSENKS